MARYIITDPPHYRDSRLYERGEVLDIPDNVKPPRTAIPIESKPAPKPDPVKTVDDVKKIRASDKSPV